MDNSRVSVVLKTVAMFLFALVIILCFLGGGQRNRASLGGNGRYGFSLWSRRWTAPLILLLLLIIVGNIVDIAVHPSDIVVLWFLLPLMLITATIIWVSFSESRRRER